MTQKEQKKETVSYALREVSKQLKMTEDELAKKLAYISEIAEELIPQIDCHNMGVNDARNILIYCGFGCDELSPEGFIDWLSKKMKEDIRLRGAYLSARSTIWREKHEID